jgi:hypothetical protein
MPTEGKPASGPGATPPSGPQATSPDLEDTDHGWSEPPSATPDTTPDLAKPPGFPPPPPLPAARVAELESSVAPNPPKPAEPAPPPRAGSSPQLGSSPRVGSSPQLGSSPRAGSSPQLGSSPRAAASPPTAELPVPGVPGKELGSAPVASKQPVAPAPPPLPPANPALATTEPHTVITAAAPGAALAVTEPQRAAMPVPTATAPVAPVPPAFPVAPELPPPLPMSSVKPMAERPVLVSPVAKVAPTPSEAALHPPSFLSGLRVKPSAAWLVLGLLVVLIAFGGGLLTGRSLAPEKEQPSAATKPEKEKGAAARPTPAAEQKPAAEPAAAAAAPAAKAPEGGGGPRRPFNAKAARLAVDRAAARAKSCKDARDPAGSVSATVTFAPSGKVSEVAITTPRYANTKTGTCVASRLREARVPEFSGNPVTVKKSLLVK